CFMLRRRLNPSKTTPSTGGSGVVASIWGAKHSMGSRSPSPSASPAVHAPAARTTRAARTRPLAVSRAKPPPSRRISRTGQPSHTAAPHLRPAAAPPPGGGGVRGPRSEARRGQQRFALPAGRAEDAADHARRQGRGERAKRRPLDPLEVEPGAPLAVGDGAQALGVP